MLALVMVINDIMTCARNSWYNYDFSWYNYDFSDKERQKCLENLL